MRQAPAAHNDQASRMSAIDKLISNNARYADGSSPAALEAAPAMGVAIVTCMDARVDPAALLGLSPGDAHVLRNAGGMVSDEVIHGLAISQHALGTREIMLIQHTKCAALETTTVDIEATIEAASSVRVQLSIDDPESLEAGLRAAIARVTESPLIAEDSLIRGFVYDVETGRLREVE
jgi:carbonic anhydrase